MANKKISFLGRLGRGKKTLEKFRNDTPPSLYSWLFGAWGDFPRYSNLNKDLLTLIPRPYLCTFSCAYAAVLLDFKTNDLLLVSDLMSFSDPRKLDMVCFVVC